MSEDKHWTFDGMALGEDEWLPVWGTTAVSDVQTYIDDAYTCLSKRPRMLMKMGFQMMLQQWAVGTSDWYNKEQITLWMYVWYTLEQNLC